MLSVYFACKQFIVAATSILGQQAIAFKIRRMALEIAERNTDAARLILVGIEPNGTVMSAQIKALLTGWFNGNIEEISLSLNKRRPTTVALSPETDFNDAVVVIVDDVANSGKTLTYAIKPLLEYFPCKIQTLVLIDRTHKEFPVKPDYIGLSIATSPEDFIDVELENGVLVRAIVDQK
jgi:pyrimidine operon attenuation protein/uracil phosphoribosyltransferase